MSDPGDHAPDGGCVCLLDGAVQPPETQGPDGLLLVFRVPDGAPSVRNPQSSGHGVVPLPAAPQLTISSTVLPRVSATCAAVRSSPRAFMVARTTLMGFEEPRD